MRRIGLFILLLSALTAGAVCRAGEHPWENKRIYYIIEYRGELREKGFFTRYTGSYQRRPCVITEEEKASYLGGGQENPIRVIKTKTITTPSGLALQRSEEVTDGDRGKETIVIQADEIEFISSGYFGESAHIPGVANPLFEITGDWLAAQGPAEGKMVSASLINRQHRSITTQDVAFRRDPTSPGGNIWLAELTGTSLRPLVVRFTTDGRISRMESENLVYQIVSRAEFEQGRIARGRGPALLPEPEQDSADPLPRMPASPPPGVSAGVPAWDSFAWINLNAAPTDRWQEMLRPSEYATTGFGSYGMQITAMRNAPLIDGTATLPMAVPPDVQPYLAPSAFIPANSSAVLEAAHAAISGSESNPSALQTLSWVAGWINQNIDRTPWTGYATDAMDTLATRRGDSLAHARLFAAMCRALGMPSRICQGFLAYRSGAAHHCWAEAWINGQWIPVDTTVSRVGLPAGYVLAERSGADGFLRLDFATFMREPDIEIYFTSAGRETPLGQMAELVLGDKRTYAYSEGDWLTNLYWGFALRLPAGWSGQARLNSVSITSPDGLASVKCEALAGDYAAGKTELDETTAQLRQTLQNFRIIDSRVVSFDSGGATPALYLDFSCVEDGVRLRCRQYIVPRRQRAFRLSFWTPQDSFGDYAAEFDSLLASFEY